MSEEEKALILAVQAALKPEHKPKQYMDTTSHHMFGHRHGAAQALYCLLGGQENGYTLQKTIDDAGDGHFWVLSPTGEPLDPTAAQYTDLEKASLYAKGRGYPLRFMTKNAKAIMEYVSASG